MVRDHYYPSLQYLLPATVRRQGNNGMSTETSKWDQWFTFIPNVFQTTIIIHLSYTFTCVSGISWPILCWHSVKQTKPQTKSNFVGGTVENFLLENQWCPNTSLEALSAFQNNHILTKFSPISYHVQTLCSAHFHYYKQNWKISTDNHSPLLICQLEMSSVNTWHLDVLFICFAVFI